MLLNTHAHTNQQTKLFSIRLHSWGKILLQFGRCCFHSNFSNRSTSRVLSHKTKKWRVKFCKKKTHYLITHHSFPKSGHRSKCLRFFFNLPEIFGASFEKKNSLCYSILVLCLLFKFGVSNQSFSSFTSFNTDSTTSGLQKAPGNNTIWAEKWLQVDIRLIE